MILIWRMLSKTSPPTVPCHLIDTGTKTHAYKGRGVFGSYSAYETDGQAVSMKDVKLTCLQSELTDTPMIDDVINGMRVLSIKKTLPMLATPFN